VGKGWADSSWKYAAKFVPLGVGLAVMYTSDRRKSGSRRRRKRVTPRFWIIVASIVFIYLGSSYAAGFIEIWRMRGEIRQIQEEIAAAEARNDALRQELDYLLSDEYIEKVAREELGLVKPGETPVIVTTPNGRMDPGRESGGSGPGSTGP